MSKRPTKPKTATIPRKTLAQYAAERAAVMRSDLPTAEKLRRLRGLSQ